MNFPTNGATRARPVLVGVVLLGLLLGCSAGVLWYQRGTQRLIELYAADQLNGAREHVLGINRLLDRMVADAAILDGIARELSASSADIDALRAALSGAIPRGLLGAVDSVTMIALGDVLHDGIARATLHVDGGEVRFLHAADGTMRMEARATGGRVHLQVPLRVFGSSVPQRNIPPTRLAATLLRVGNAVIVIDQQSARSGLPMPGALLSPSDLPAAIAAVFDGDTVRMAAPRGLLDSLPTIVAAVPASSPELAFVLQRQTRDVIGRPTLARSRLREALAIGCATALMVILMGTLWRLRTLGQERDVLATRHAFVTAVSHELRTPLAQIGAFAELLDEEMLATPDDRSRAVRTILHETRRLELLVENVLSFGRPAGQPAVRSVLNADVTREIDDARAAFTPIALRAGAVVTPDVELGLVVRMPPHALRQVLLNLLDNAVKYGPPGQVVRVEARRSGAECRIVVLDQGRGVPLTEIERVWEPFVRGAGSESFPGSGLGLAVVRQLVEASGGTVTMESQAGIGTRVTMKLPLTEESA